MCAAAVGFCRAALVFRWILRWLQHKFGRMRWYIHRSAEAKRASDGTITFNIADQIVIPTEYYKYIGQHCGQGIPVFDEDVCKVMKDLLFHTILPAKQERDQWVVMDIQQFFGYIEDRIRQNEEPDSQDSDTSTSAVEWNDELADDYIEMRDAFEFFAFTEATNGIGEIGEGSTFLITFYDCFTFSH